MDPDCAAGKHSNCEGTGWDTANDRFAPCPCPCGHNKPTARGARA